MSFSVHLLFLETRFMSGAQGGAGGEKSIAGHRDSIMMVMMKKKETYSLLLVHSPHRRFVFSILLLTINQKTSQEPEKKMKIKKNVNEARDGEKIS